MRKIVHCIVVLSVSIFFVWSCSKEKGQQPPDGVVEKKPDQSVQTLFENKNLPPLGQKKFSIFDDHTLRVERIGYDNKELLILKSNTDWQKLLTTYQLDVRDIQRRKFDNSIIQILTIPILGVKGNQWLLAYNYNDRFVFAIARQERLENGNLYCAITSTAGNTHYDFQISPENKLGKLKVVSPLPLRETFFGLAKDLNPLTDLNVLDDEHDDYTPCCKRPFNDCMNCFVQSCSSDWTCWWVCGVGPGPVVCAAAWALSCSTQSGC